MITANIEFAKTSYLLHTWSEIPTLVVTFGLIMRDIRFAQPLVGNEETDELKNVINYSKWPPSGKRGVGFSRANLFGKNFDKYVEEAQQPIVIAMIENMNAVNELDNILKVEGLDAILIGPYDLSASLNLTAKFNEQEFLDVMQTIKAKADKKNIPCGIHVVEPDKTELIKKIDDGYRFIPYSIDSVVFEKHIINPLKINK